MALNQTDLRKGGLDVQYAPVLRNSSRVTSVLRLVFVLVCLSWVVQAQSQSRNIVCRPELSASHRESLANKLRSISGWARLDFDSVGTLQLGNRNEIVGGSQTARELLTMALSGPNVLVIEDASDRADVVFARVIEGRWTRGAQGKPPVRLVLLDFADFKHVVGDNDARVAFNEAWALLHEIAHVVHNSADADANKGVGECEGLINKMRRECGVAERSEYFFNYFPGQESSRFNTRFVRLAFDLKSSNSNKSKRIWIMWDGAVVGGLDNSRQVASK